ncbi:MAG: hypothetical protein IT541_07870 [Hyphomicrobiales bacterium]|nr:hypothetical protein [Hyphomicrobiales bacterium]
MALLHLLIAGMMWKKFGMTLTYSGNFYFARATPAAANRISFLICAADPKLQIFVAGWQIW